MNKIILGMLMILSTNAFAKVSNEKLYKTILQDLEQIGETNKHASKEDKEFSLISRTTSLMAFAMNSKKDEVLDIPEGVFLMLAPEKKNLTKFDSAYYSRFFASDQFGSAFLYKDYIVTNYHMCRGLNTLIRDHKNNVYGAQVLKWNDKQDVCILKAPSSVKDQRNFATFKPSANAYEDKKAQLLTEIEIETLKAKKNFTAEDVFKIQQLQAKLKKSTPDYGTVHSIWGEFKVTDFEKDEVKDMWTKEEGFSGYGKSCKSGISGGVVTSPNGIIGYAWGAEEKEALQKRIAQMERLPSGMQPKLEEKKKPICFFVNVSEIEKLIKDYESEQSK